LRVAHHEGEINVQEQDPAQTNNPLKCRRKSVMNMFNRIGFGLPVAPFSGTPRKMVEKAFCFKGFQKGRHPGPSGSGLIETCQPGVGPVTYSLRHPGPSGSGLIETLESTWSPDIAFPAASRPFGVGPH